MDGKYKELISDMVPLIMDELNVKNVVFAEELGKYMNFELKPNLKVAGPVLGKKIKGFAGALAKENPENFMDELEEKGDRDRKSVV